MPIIPSILSMIKRAIGPMVPRLRLPGLRAITRLVSFRARRQGHTVSDIVQTVTSGQPESVAAVLGQSVFTTTRMLDTYASVLASDDTKLLPRNLIVSAKLKTARNYQVFFLGDVINPAGEVIQRRWFSMYTDTQKAFSEWLSDIDDMLSKQKYETGFTFGNFELQHLLHRRGAPFLPVS